MNVSPVVYDIFDVTGFTKLLNVKRHPREISVEGCEEIGSGAYIFHEPFASALLALYENALRKRLRRASSRDVT